MEKRWVLCFSFTNCGSFLGRFSNSLIVRISLIFLAKIFQGINFSPSTSTTNFLVLAFKAGLIVIFRKAILIHLAKPGLNVK
jgi:hypothetical protein